jgi:tetratricopeptide (TPR) repeat protein
MKRTVFTLTIVGLFFVFGLVVATGLLAPKTAIDLDAMSAASKLYDSGHFAEATKIYEQMAARGVEDSTLFYNLGNAYYRQGDLGRSVLNFQRAARLAPRDGDIQANLDIARAGAIEAFPEEATGPLHSLGQVTGRWLSLNETALLAVSLWFGLGFLVLVRLNLEPGSLRTSAQYAIAVGGVLLILIGLSLGSRIYTENTRPDGVIIADAVALSSEPNHEHATDISLHSGTEVKLAETSGDWIRLASPGGAMQGWIPVEAVEAITGQSGRL